jgi:Tetratricopeptide repeat
MGRYYWEQGQSDEAEGLEIQVLELRKEVLGEKHPDTIRAMADLRLICENRISHNKAAQPKSESSSSKPRQQIPGALSMHHRLASFLPRIRFKKGQT